MGLFRKSKPKQDKGFMITSEEEIIAYIEEAFRMRVPLTVIINKKRVLVDILYIDEKNKALRIQDGRINNVPPGSDAMVGFPLDKTWWAFQSKFVISGDKPHLLIPKAIKHSERRKAQRTSFTPREQVKVTVLEGLGSGNGVFGLANDISPSGINISIDKAMILSSQREVPPSEDLFKKGAPLAFVKINKLPGFPLLEVSGIANRIYRDGSKWRLAIQFHKLDKGAASMITRFVEPRLLEFKPVRRSKRRQEDENDPLTAPIKRDAPSSGKRSGPAPSTNKKDSAGDGSSAAETTQAGDVAEAAAPVELPPFTGDRTKVLVMGTETESELAFLNHPSSPVELLTATTPVSVVKILTESSPPVILCSAEFKGRKIKEVLEKVANMGVLENRKIFVLANDLDGKDIIKLKMLKVQEIFSLPLENPSEFLQKLLS